MTKTFQLCMALPYVFKKNSSKREHMVTGYLKGSTIREVMGVGGNFQLAGIFFGPIACAGIFFAGKTLCMNFF